MRRRSPAYASAEVELGQRARTARGFWPRASHDRAIKLAATQHRLAKVQLGKIRGELDLAEGPGSGSADRP